MSFDGTGGRGPSLQDLFGLLQGLGTAGPDLGDDPIAQAQADIARRAWSPKTGGLFGGDYARFMADNAPQTRQPAPSSDGGPSSPVPSSRAVFGPQAFGVDADQLTIDPTANYQVAGPAAAKPYPRTLDPIIETKVAAFNKMNRAVPGDDVYLDPDLIKAMVQVESGFDPRAYASDPMQVNKQGDWDPYKADIGLRKGAPPGQDLGVQAGLDWLDSKSYRFDSKGKAGPFLGYDEAVRRYNGYHDGHGNPHYVADVKKAFGDIKAGR